VTEAQAIPDTIGAHLAADEQVLWLGRPPQGVRLLGTGGNTQLPGVFYLLLYLGFSASIMGKNDARWWWLQPVGYVLMLIAVVVSLVSDARQRARIHYALTSERVIVAGRAGRGSVQFISLLTLPGLSLIEGVHGRGTVLLGFAAWRGSKRHDWMTTDLPGTGNNAPLQFNMIADARRVYQMIRDAQKRVWGQHPLEPSGGQSASAQAIQADRIPASIGADLSADEQVLWIGQPRQGLMLRAMDAVMAPLTLAVAVVVGFLCWYWFSSWIAGALHTERSGFWFINGLFIFLVLLVFYILVGRFFTDAWQRAKIHYALTSERLIIARSPARSRMQSVNLRTLPNPSLFEGKDGCGIVWLSPAPYWKRMTAGNVFDINNPPYLDTIPDAQRVYQLIRDAQKRASPET